MIAQRRYKREPLADDELDRLVRACDGFREQLIVFTLLDAGLRVSELADLSKRDIHWSRRCLLIRSRGRGPAKSSNDRLVPMTPRVYPLLERHFATKDGFGLTKRQLQRIVTDIARRAGVERSVTPQVLRHTFSVGCLKRGIGMQTLRYLMGHQRPSPSEMYVTLSPDDAIREFRAKW